jgi:hypothetical protein
MDIQSLFGLPAHPLVVHAVVVLLPLAAIGLVLTAALPGSRRHYGPLVLAAAFVALVSVGIATGSGESLQERVKETQSVEDHAEAGNVVLPWAVAVTILAAAVVAAGPVQRRKPDLSAKTVTTVLLVAAVISATGAIWTVAEAGHTGAKATWGNLPAEGGGEGAEGRDGG